MSMHRETARRAACLFGVLALGLLARRTDAQPSADTRDVRAILAVGERTVEPIVCFDMRERRYVRCIPALRQGDRVGFGDGELALGRRLRFVGDMCGDPDVYASTPVPAIDADAPYPRLAVFPSDADFDVRRVSPYDDPPPVSDAERRTLAPAASAYFRGASGNGMDDACAANVARVRPENVQVRQRVEIDMDGDGSLDRLYVAQAAPSDPAACARAWSALVLVRGGARPEPVVLADSEDAMIAVTGSFELDGVPPRELMYRFGYEGSHDHVGRIEGGSLVGLWSDGCDP